ncbi:GHKL domain-containing protein [Enterococcus caccae]
MIFSYHGSDNLMYMELPNEFLLGTTFSMLIMITLFFKQVSYNEVVSQVSLIYLVVYFVRNVVPLILVSIFSEVDMFTYSIAVTIFSVIIYSIIDKQITNLKNKYYFSDVTKVIPSLLFVGILILNFIMIYFMNGDDSGDATMKSVMESHKVQNYSNIRTLSDGSFYLLFFVGVMISMAFIIINNNVKNQKLKFQLEKAQELENYIQSIELIRDEILSYQHDYDNIFIGLSGLIYNENFNLDKLKQYYESSSNQVLKNKGIRIIKLLNMKNLNIPELKGILAHKILLANQKGINLHFEVTDLIEHIEMDKTDLTRCIGILVDNAIEATEKSSIQEIDIAFIRKSNSVIFVIQNTFESEKSRTTELQTAGEKRIVEEHIYRHGFGLKNIQMIINQYKNIQIKTKVVQNRFIQEIHFYEEE